MSLKHTLLIVGNYNRRDFIDLFKSCRNDFNFLFLEFASPAEIKDRYYTNYGKAIFWGDFKNTFHLLETIAPHKVLFFFIESYYHVILNITCKLKGIDTYHIDHGIRDLNINIRLEHHFINQKSDSRLLKSIQKISQVKHRLNARFFLLKSIKALPPMYAEFFRYFYEIRKRNHYLNTFKQINSPLRTADAYITFSRKVLEVHQQHDFLSEDKRVHIIGFPPFDYLSNIDAPIYNSKQILFIDQGLAAREILGWNDHYYHVFASKFIRICKQYGYKVMVKLHPVQTRRDSKLWAQAENTEVVNNQNLIDLLPHTPVVIGFFSTLLLPLAAMPHTTLITLENHPAGRLDVSKSFIDAGVAHPVYSLDELPAALETIDQLHQQQLPNKKKFEEEWLYKFDGKAGERLRDILLSDEL